MSPFMPARCRHCGRSFSGQGGLLIEDSQSVTLKGVQITCPHCGRLADIIDGTLNVEAGAIEMLSGPQWSWDLVEELGLALRRAVREPQANPVRPVAAASPEFADLITTAVREGLERGPVKNTSKHRRKLTIGVLTALSTLLATDYGTVEHNLEGLKGGIALLLHYVATHGVLPPPWG